MSFLEIVLLSVSLALDAAIAAVGVGAHGHKKERIFEAAILFGLFQGGMAFLGFVLGFGFRDYLIAYGPIIGFTLLMLVGGKMLIEAFKKDEDADVLEKGVTTRRLFVLAVATSIDALVVGITFNVITVNIPLTVLSIGLVTLVLALLGGYVGMRGKRFFGNRVEIIGGLVLMVLALKILFMR